MKLKPYVRQTEYGAFTSQKIRAALRFRNQYFTAEELARDCATPNTHNFRRLLNVLAEYHEIEKFYAQNEKGRIAAIYARKGTAAP